MNKKLFVLTLTGVAVTALAISAPSALAYKGDPAVQGPNYTAERHQIMTKAFETNDYNAWKNQMAGKGRVTQVVTQQNFAKFAEAHKLAEAGKMNEAKAIRAELGLGLQNGSGRGQGTGMGKNR